MHWVIYIHLSMALPNQQEHMYVRRTKTQQQQRKQYKNNKQLNVEKRCARR